MFNVYIQPTPNQYKMFSDALHYAKQANKNGHYVSYFRPSQLDALCCTLFLNEEHTAGFAVTKTGELVAVFKHPLCTAKNVMGKIVPLAKLYGAKRLECFETLAPFYVKHGFRVLTKTPWNDEFAPTDWIGDERPNYLTMSV